MKEETKIPEGVIILLIFLFTMLIFTMALTDFNPFRNCEIYTNSTYLMDCWFA